MADSDKPAVPVALVSLARHPVGFDDPGQGESGFLAASPLGAAGGAFLFNTENKEEADKARRSQRYITGSTVSDLDMGFSEAAVTRR